MKFLSLFTAVGAAALLSSCATPFKEPATGPVAYVRFLDTTGQTLWGTRKTGAFLYEKEDCSDIQGIPGTDWVRVPAGKPLVLKQLFANYSGVVQVQCSVMSSFSLNEGQHVEFEYSIDFTGGGVRCKVVPTEINEGTNQRRAIQVLRPAPAACQKQ